MQINCLTASAIHNTRAILNYVYYIQGLCSALKTKPRWSSYNLLVTSAFLEGTAMKHRFTINFWTGRTGDLVIGPYELLFQILGPLIFVFNWRITSAIYRIKESLWLSCKRSYLQYFVWVFCGQKASQAN